MRRGISLLSFIIRIHSHHIVQDFPSTEQIFLEENYRSTSAILTVSHAIVSQGKAHFDFSAVTFIWITFDLDKARIAKGLFTSHGKGSPPVLRLLQNEYAEGDFISSEIKRLIAYSGGILGWNDFSVLRKFVSSSMPTKLNPLSPQ